MLAVGWWPQASIRDKSWLGQVPHTLLEIVPLLLCDHQRLAARLSRDERRASGQTQDPMLPTLFLGSTYHLSQVVLQRVSCQGQASLCLHPAQGLSQLALQAAATRPGSPSSGFLVDGGGGRWLASSVPGPQLFFPTFLSTWGRYTGIPPTGCWVTSIPHEWPLVT